MGGMDDPTPIAEGYTYWWISTSNESINALITFPVQQFAPCSLLVDVQSQ